MRETFLKRREAAMTKINNINTAKRCLGLSGLSIVALALASCATTSYPPAAIDSRNELLAAHLAATNGIEITAESRRAIEDRILALDPDRIGDGEWSQNPYRSSERLAGQLAWYYERDGMRPMLIGHSQGGMQTVKVLHELAGDFGDHVPVWNPVTNQSENRQTILDPLTRAERPVVGVKLSYASVVGAGGLEFWAATSWSLAGRLRAIPDSVEEFTGYSIAADPIALTPPSGATSYDLYRQTGNAKVHNVNLPIAYSHVTVPNTDYLADEPRKRDWINAYTGGKNVDAA